MRSTRIRLLLLAFYFVFLGGSAYYTLIFPVRLFHHAFVTILVSIWFFRKLSRDGLPYTPLNRPIYAAVVVWFITSVTSIDPRMAFEHLWFVLLHVVMFFALVDLLQRGRQRVVMEIQFILAALVILITGLEVASWYFGFGVTPGTEIGWLDVIGPGVWLPLELPRASLAMNISTLLAGYVAPLVTLTLAWGLTVRRKDYRQVLLLVSAGLFMVLIFTFSRGGLLSVIAALGTLGVMRAAQQANLRRFLSPRLLLGGAVIGAVVIIAVFSVSQFRNSGDQIRLDLYRSATQMFVDYPITGVGTGIYGRAYREYRVSSVLTRDRLASAHNAYLNTAAETGLLGLGVSVWMGTVLLRTWWLVWKQQGTSERKLRHEAVIAALIGVAVHSLVDVFTTTPVVSVIVLLLAYSVVGHRTVLDERPAGVRWAAGVGLMITLVYGVFFLQIDRANIQYRQSLAGGEGASEAVQAAASIDPNLNLYNLHLAYLLGEQAVDDPTDENITTAIAAYEQALSLEPTWHVGWINLAGLEAQQGDLEAAVTHLETALEINPIDPSRVHLARFAETLGEESDKDVIRLYRGAMHWNILQNDRLPVIDFWLGTELRQAALKNYTAFPVANIEWDYRIWSGLRPGWASAFVVNDPATAPANWVAGEYALTFEGDVETASEFFSTAIAKSSRNGDYYAARARATYLTDPDMARRDLDIAQLLGTQFEYPNVTRAAMAQDAETRDGYLVMALPPRIAPQEFAAVLYGGRAAVFDVILWMRPYGPGREVMQPWYTIAENHRISARIDSACRVYDAIVNYAPDEEEARAAMMELGCET